MPRLLSPRLARAALALAAAGALGGCGRTVVVGSGAMVRITLSEYRINPQIVHVNAGKLTIFVRNYGRLTHNLAVSPGHNAATKPIAPGQGAEITLTLTRGTYRLESQILSDEALGEYGTLVVT
ncbi:MAG: cupredoxin domain-containing protein [Solirubrobacteraceae bacterium]